MVVYALLLGHLYSKLKLLLKKKQDFKAFRVFYDEIIAAYAFNSSGMGGMVPV